MSRLSSASVAQSMRGQAVVIPSDGSDPFVLERLIGAGSVGKVYQGTYEGQQVAIKVISGLRMDDEQMSDAQLQQRRGGMTAKGGVNNSGRAPTLPGATGSVVDSSSDSDSDDMSTTDSEQDARERRMAQFEGLLLSVMNHPNIVRTYKVCSESKDSAHRRRRGSRSSAETDGSAPFIDEYLQVR